MKTLITLLLACCFGSAMAQSNLPACQSEVSPRTDCFGSHTYADGDTYVGEWKDGKRHGQGTVTQANGLKYVGEFKDDKKNGRGTVSVGGGAIEYVGEWKDDKKNGRGTLTFADYVYVGEWKNNKQHGQGTLTFSDYVYVGEFKDDKQHGQGTLTYADGNKYVGEFKDDKGNGQGTYTWPDGDKYVGEFKDGKRNGQGTHTWASGDKYVGEWKDGKNNGQGTHFFLADNQFKGDKYVGEWKDNKFSGQGTYTYADGNKYVGEFKDGKRNGQGTHTWASGDKYVGEWKDNKFSGQGVVFLANGNVAQSGIWKEDELIESKFIDVATFTRIPNLSNSASNLAQLRKTEEQAKQKQAELEAQRKASELALAQATQAAQEQAKLENQLVAAQQQTPAKPPPLAPQGKRVALVIGNAKYKFNPLNNPVNDATDMAASLRSVGFDVIEVKDATLKQMRAATRQFADKLEVSDVGLVYYSGHGIEVKGKNYLIPVNADIRREYEVVDQAFDASNLLRMMEGLQSGTKKRVNILIVDACRNNDLPKSWRSTNNGLARMDAPAGSFISFATAPGQVASDGQGRNSPYTKHLLQALKQPGMPIEQVFKQVRRKVMAETGGEQVPWENSSLVGDFYFTVAR
jgi:hypothetical protein